MGVNPDTNKLEINITDYSKAYIKKGKSEIVLDGGYIDFSDVYRAMVKFVIGMLPDAEIIHFKETISWINKKMQLYFQM